jgi:hypothetical protein
VARSHSVGRGRLAQASDPHWHHMLPAPSLTACVHGGPTGPGHALVALGARSAHDDAAAAA